MSLFFDTSILIDLERMNEKTIKKLKELKEIYPALPIISFVSYVEFLYGIRNKSFENREKIKSLIREFGVVHTTNTTAEILISLKDKYEYPLADLLIASQVIEHEGVLVTKDKDFEEIKELDKIIIG